MHKDLKDCAHEITDMLHEKIFRATKAANSVLKRRCHFHSLTKNLRYFLVMEERPETALYDCSPS